MLALFEGFGKYSGFLGLIEFLKFRKTKKPSAIMGFKLLSSDMVEVLFCLRIQS